MQISTVSQSKFRKQNRKKLHWTIEVTNTKAGGSIINYWSLWLKRTRFYLRELLVWNLQFFLNPHLNFCQSFTFMDDQEKRLPKILNLLSNKTSVLIYCSPGSNRLITFSHKDVIWMSSNDKYIFDSVTLPFGSAQQNL